MAKNTSINLTKTSNIGRPKTWTDERLIKVTADCLRWLEENPQCVSKVQYAAYIGESKHCLDPAKSVNPVFQENLKKIHTLLEARLIQRLVESKNSIPYLFLLKAKYGYIEEEKQQKQAQTVVHHHIPRADMAKLGDSDLQEQIRKLTSG